MLTQLSADFFARSPLLAWPVFALALFLGVFVAICARTLFARRDEMQRMAALPIQDSEGDDHD